MKKIIPILVCVVFGFAIINSCKKDPEIPTLTTKDVTNITINSVTTGGAITKDGGAGVTGRGVCWGTSASPSISDSYTSDDSGIGSFISTITGLTPNTEYHIRAYATNKAGTAYGVDISFTTTPIVVPTLTTAAITSITLTTAVSGGNITDDGNADITAKGVCWATTTGPTITSSLTTDGTGKGSFVSNLSGLQPGIPYFLRAYATNSAGTSYGNEITFTTIAVVVPTLTTAGITAFTLTTAISGGNITTDGGGAITARGTCWATTPAPTIAKSKTSEPTGTGSFISNLTGLLPGTIYYVRAYATNSAGTAYGNEITFTSAPITAPALTTNAVTSITLTSAVSGGNVIADNGGSVTARGICWATTTVPTISNNKTTTGTGTGSFMSNMTGLSSATTYYVRAYATNSAGTAYGNEISFTSGQTLVPTLTTTNVSAITYTTASSGGNIAADGGMAVTAKGVCWAISQNPTISNSLTSDGTGTGIFTSSLTGLLPGTIYHVRAYAINSVGTAYGQDISFTTNAILLPTLTTNAVTTITYTTAVSGGNITLDGGGAVTARGICWATTTNPLVSDFKATSGIGTGSFISNLISLQPGTTYHVRAFATNSAGTAYGTDVPFSTNAVILPTVTSVAITSINVSSASSGGNVTNDGGGTISARGVCWAITPAPVITNFETTDGTGPGIFTSTLTGLLPGTLYYLRAYATNSAGTSYGIEFSFYTKIADADGNIYSTVLIGTQLWMGENLKTTKYSNGVSIGTTFTPTDDVTSLTTPYQWPVYNGGTDVSATYGRLYTWYAATDSRNVCPTGWHVPTDTELEDLKTTLGGDAVAGGKLKETGLSHWTTPNTGATNNTGFTALPAGYRQSGGGYVSLGLSSYLWSSNPDDTSLAWGQQMSNANGVLLRGGYFYASGVSVRCLK